MSETNPKRQIFSDESKKVVPWSSVAGGSLVEFKSNVEVRRGVSFQETAGVGVSALFNKMKNVPIFADITGEAKVQFQAQSPLDMLEEAGVAVRLQAIARVAAGIGLKPNINIEQLRKIVTELPDMKGTPTELFNLLLEEIRINGVLYAQAAIAIMAYANLVATGSLFSDDEDIKPGFNMVFEAGYGFKVGAGYRGYVEVNFDSPRKLIYRYSDLAVSKMIARAEQSGLSSSQLSLIRSLQAPIVATTRLALEIGQLSKEQAITRSITIILQETQRWIISKLANVQDEATRWAAGQLGELLNSQMSKLTEPFKFSGPLSTKPSEKIRRNMNTQLGRKPDAELSIEIITQYLLGKPLQQLLAKTTEIQIVANIFSNAFPGGAEESMRAMFAYTRSSESNEVELMRRLAAGLKSFVAEVIKSPSFVSALDKVFATNKELGTLMRSACIPGIELATQVTFPYILNEVNYDRKLIREAVSSVLLTLIGRNVIRIFNGIVMKIQQDIGGLLRDASKKLNSVQVQDILRVTGKSYMRKPLEAGFQEAAKLFGDFIPQKLFDRIFDVFTPIGGAAISSYVDNLRNTSWMPRLDKVYECYQLMLSVLATKAPIFVSRIIGAVLRAFLDYLKEELERLIAIFKIQMDRLKERIIMLIQMNIANLLTGIIRNEVINKAIEKVPSQFRSLVEKAVDGVIREVVANQLMKPINDALNRLLFDPGKVLQIMSVPNNVNEFVKYVISVIEKEVKKLGAGLRFKLDVTISLPDLPKLPFVLDQPSSAIQSGSGEGEGLVKPSVSRVISLGQFTLTPSQILRAIGGVISPIELERRYFSILQYAFPGIQQLKRIAEFEVLIPQIIDQFKVNRSLAPDIQTSTFDALIVLRPAEEERSSRSIEVVLHYVGLERGERDDPHRYPTVAVFLNNRDLPLDSFHYAWDAHSGISGRQSGLLLWRTLTVQDLQEGENLLYTIATDIHGRSIESGTRFSLLATER
ncbi:hypothetical protein [Paenibacillus assamensis]|uniref:hypothetical protein n=1 Tax=Paenibacillus assamensis TaxID=311244 RepID=UPI000684602E|nr:hypothetical protein [Paenibacillus assamensis]